MKKILLIAVNWMIFSSCAKEVKAPDKENNQVEAAALKGDQSGRQTGGYKPVRAIATVRRDRDVREGGIGWYLQVNAYEWVVPDNLPSNFEVEGARVDVAYVPTNKPVPNYYNEKEPKYLVHIQSINKVDDSGQ